MMDPEEVGITEENSLATEKVGKLIMKYAIPAVIAQLVGAMYNIVDQYFIGQKVGVIGNAVTSVAFPLTTICMAASLLTGNGVASNFNLAMGEGDRERASNIASNGISWMLIIGVTISAFALAFLRPMLTLFGADEELMGYAMTYTGITALGIPALIFSNAASRMIRSDGSPTWSMLCTVSGAILNCILDPILIYGFDMGMAGAAWATVMGQVLSALIAAWYFIFKFKTVPISLKRMKPRIYWLTSIAGLGAAAGINQVAITFVQIVMNNVLSYYGALSVYGTKIPLASVGVVSKISTLIIAFTIGISQGSQPIIGFNYGAKNYDRVKSAYLYSVRLVLCISMVAFIMFQLFPRQIVAIFGDGSEAYFSFAEQYMRIYLLMVFAIGIQPLTSGFFTSIGKPYMGIFMSLTRQVIFLIPLIYIFPMLMGIDGIIFAGPISDSAAILLAIIFSSREMKRMDFLMAQKNNPDGLQAG